MGLNKKLLIEPEKTTEKLNLKDWDTGYDDGKRKEDVESELAHFSSQMSELQF